MNTNVLPIPIKKKSWKYGKPLGEKNLLRNRDMRIRAENDDNSENKVQNDILKIIAERPNITQKELADLINKSERSIKTIMTAMQEQNLIARSGSKKTGYWKILSCTSQDKI